MFLKTCTKMHPYTEKTGRLKKRTDAHAFEECGTLLHLTNVSKNIGICGSALLERFDMNYGHMRSSAATVQVSRTDSYMQIL